ncbi:MAG: hypothetical protein WCY59_02660 [Anaerovoracaceae bacterium]
MTNKLKRAAVAASFAALFRVIAGAWQKLDPDINDLHIYGGAAGLFYGIKTMLPEYIVVFGFFLVWGAYEASRAAKG